MLTISIISIISLLIALILAIDNNHKNSVNTMKVMEQTIDQVVRAIKSKDASEFADTKQQDNSFVERTEELVPLDAVSEDKLLKALENENK
jgi:ABC-type transporter MlaC component